MFLDELANTSGLVQEKLLRVIEYGEFERVGGKKTMQVDVRLIAATNEDLPRLASEGNFRLDLLDRLAFDVITLPPLRERAEDIALLAEYFAINMASELGRSYFPGFTEGAQQAMAAYGWPGNLRELKNVVERAVYRTEPELPVSEIVLDPFESPYRPGSKDEGSPPATRLPVDLKQTVRDLEVDFVNRAMATGRFNQRRAAELLGLTYHQFRGYLKKYDHERHDGSPADGQPTSDTTP